MQSKDVKVTGFVTEEELDDLYSKIRLVVVPLRTGAGVKGKIIESVYHKVPVVTTSIGIEGINNTSNIISVKDGESDLAKEIIGLYNNFVELNKKSEQSESFIKEFFSDLAVEKALAEYIKE